MRFGDLFLDVAKSAISLQDPKTGAMVPGFNGPYKDPETPARNTAHWLQCFLKCHEIDGDARYRQAALAAAKYLTGPDAPRAGYSYHHRNKEGKDKCNGLIGQAWTLEGLIAAYRKLGMDECLDVAQSVFLKHPFDELNGLWSRVEPDGTLLSEDVTFNHQLWFCAAGSMMTGHGSPEIRARVINFLDHIPRLMETSEKGRILHWVKSAPGRMRRRAARALSPARRLAMTSKEVGYQTFNLYGFAIIKEEYPNHELWQRPDFRRVLDFLKDEEFRSNITESPFSYAYNPPGFEIPVILNTFSRNDQSRLEESTAWLEKQLDYRFDRAANQFVGPGLDSATLTARFYECSRFPSDMLSVEISID